MDRDQAQFIYQSIAWSPDIDRPTVQVWQEDQERRSWWFDGSVGTIEVSEHECEEWLGTLVRQEPAQHITTINMTVDMTTAVRIFEETYNRMVTASANARETIQAATAAMQPVNDSWMF